MRLKNNIQIYIKVLLHKVFLSIFYNKRRDTESKLESKCCLLINNYPIKILSQGGMPIEKCYTSHLLHSLLPMM